MANSGTRDVWSKLEAAGGVLTALSVALLGFLGSVYLNRKQESDTRARVYAELTSQREQAENATAEVTISLEPAVYGLFAAAGVAHGMSVRRVLEAYINCSDDICDWSNDGYYLNI